jgi:hydroxyacyl-ACP dehydratase HTD2-like protein with hotdog domain
MTLTIMSRAIHEWTHAIKQQRWTLKDNVSQGPTSNLVDLLNSVFTHRIAPSTNLFYLGFHFLYTRQPNLTLGSDGYDNYQAPVDVSNKELYHRRMWVKGSLEFDYCPLISGTSLTTLEQVKSVRKLDESIFVNIQRNTLVDSRLILRESRSLIYTNEPFTYRPVSRDFHSSDRSLTLQLDPHHLLKYSMLTYNLHKIHFDLDYCQQVEKLPNIVVHGPFMITLLLHWFNSTGTDKVRSLDYKNIEPCFVNESLTLRLKQTEPKKYMVSIVNLELGKKYMEGVLCI